MPSVDWSEWRPKAASASEAIVQALAERESARGPLEAPATIEIAPPR
jgi:hypothetical protein